MDNDTCPVCGKGNLIRKVAEESFQYKGTTMVIPDYVVYVCNLCSEGIVDKQTLARSGNILNEFKNIKIASVADGRDVWVDMETKVRSGDGKLFELEKVEACLNTLIGTGML